MKKIYKKIIITLFLIYFVVTVISQQKTLNQYKSEASAYSKQLESAKDTNDELIATKDNVDSTEYIEEVAREKLDMYLPNERVYIDIGK
ncbi:MAG: septum formation initiator family protein [Clostridia bacterium]